MTHGCQGIYRIDPLSGRVTASLRIPDVGDAIAVAGGLVWVTSYHGDLFRIQPRAGQIVGRPIPVGIGDWSMVPAAGALWVTSFGSGNDSGTVSRIDVVTAAVKRFGNLDVEAAGAGSLWTPQVQRIDPATGNVTASFVVPGASQVAFWNGSAWALTVRQSLIFLRIDPAANQGAVPAPADQDRERHSGPRDCRTTDRGPALSPARVAHESILPGTTDNDRQVGPGPRGVAAC